LKQKTEIPVIPNFNYGKYTKESINSIIESALDGAKLEIIIAVLALILLFGAC